MGNNTSHSSNVVSSVPAVESNALFVSVSTNEKEMWNKLFLDGFNCGNVAMFNCALAHSDWDRYCRVISFNHGLLLAAISSPGSVAEFCELLAPHYGRYQKHAKSVEFPTNLYLFFNSEKKRFLIHNNWKLLLGTYSGYLPLNDPALKQWQTFQLYLLVTILPRIQNDPQRMRALQFVNEFIQTGVVPNRTILLPPPSAPVVPELKQQEEEEQQQQEGIAAVIKPVNTNCIVCLDDSRIRNQVFIPCYHICCCATCAVELQVCPQCRTNIDSFHTVYF